MNFDNMRAITKTLLVASVLIGAPGCASTGPPTELRTMARRSTPDELTSVDGGGVGQVLGAGARLVVTIIGPVIVKKAIDYAASRMAPSPCGPR